MRRLLRILLTLLFLSGFAVFVYVSFTQETRSLDAERNEIEGTFIKLSRGHVYYELKGPDTGKVVVLIHGAGSGSYAWDNNFPYLVKNGFRVLRYDLYGRGFSDRPNVKYDSTLFDQQLSELMDSLSLRPPFNLVSVSMGSSIALHYTKTHADKVERLVLTDPASLSDGSMAWYLKTPVVAPVLMSLYWYPRAVEKQMREFYNPGSVSEYREKSWKQMHYNGLKRAMLSSWQNMLTLNMTNAMMKIGRSNTKVLLVWGRFDPLVPSSVSEYYLEAMPQAKFVEIDSAGHLSNYEKPTTFNPILANFLRYEK